MVELAISMREGGDVLGSDNVLLEVRRHSAATRSWQHSLTYARMLANRGRVQMRLGKAGRGASVLRQSLALLQDRLGTRHPEVAALLVEKSTAFLWQDDHRGRRAQRSRGRRLSTAPCSALASRPGAGETQLGEALRLQGRLDEASVMFKERSERLQHRVRR